MSSADSLYKAHSNNSFDFENQYTGRYLKLFEQQTKNSKMGNSIFSYEQKKKEEKSYPNPFNYNDLIVENKEEHNQYTYISREEKQNQIAKDLERMRMQHIRIMGMMEEQPTVKMNKMQQIEKQLQRKSIQQFAPDYSSPPTFGNLNYQIVRENQRDTIRKESIQLRTFNENGSSYDYQNTQITQNLPQTQQSYPLKNGMQSVGHPQYIYTNQNQYLPLAKPKDIIPSKVHTPSSTQFTQHWEQSSRKVIEQLPQQSKDFQQNIKQKQEKMIPFNFYSVYQQRQHEEQRVEKDYKKSQQSERMYYNYGYSPIIKKKETEQSEKKQEKDLKQTNVHITQIRGLQTNKDLNLNRQQYNPEYFPSKYNQSSQAQPSYRQTFIQPSQQIKQQILSPLIQHIEKNYQPIDPQVLIKEVQSKFKQQPTFSITKPYNASIYITQQPIHQSLLHGLNQSVQPPKVQSYHKPLLTPKISTFQSINIAATNNIKKSFGLSHHNQRLGSPPIKQAHTPGNVFSSPRTIHDYYYNAAQEFAYKNANMYLQNEQVTFRNRVTNAPQRPDLSPTIIQNKLRPNSSAPRLLSPRRIPQPQAYVPTALLTQPSRDNAQHIIKSSFFKSPSSYQQVMLDRPISPRASSYRPTSVYNRPLRMISNEFQNQTPVISSGSPYKINPPQTKRTGSFYKKKGQGGISVTSTRR